MIDQKEIYLNNPLIPRHYYLEENVNYCFVGIRRTGKSYMMYQQIKQLEANGIPLSQIVYVNFEDERLLEMTAADLNLILEIGLEISRTDVKPYLFLDEIQNITGWEKFVRRIADMKYRINITGSNSKMLSSEIASTLGGRFVIMNIYPYSYGTAITEGTVPVWHIGALTIEKVGYQGTVLPVLAAAAILAFIEKKLHKVVPEYLDNLLTPALSVLVTAFLTFTVVGGVMRTAGDWITNGVLWLHDTLGGVGGFIFGFIYAPLTMTGMHHSLLPVDIQLIAAGGSFLFAIAACNNVAQGGATLAAMFCAKDKKMKSIAVSSGISALLGITEPAMFGVNLKMKYPFYAAMFGSAVGCAYVTLTNVQNISPGAAGIIGFVCIKSGGMLNYMIGILISLVVGFAVTIALSKHPKFKEV